MKKFQIYTGNDTTQDEPTMPEAFTAEYHHHVATLPHHKVIGPHSWKVGQRLEEGVDFKRKEMYYVLYEKDDTTSGSISLIATGINDCYSQFENNIGTPARQIINIYSEPVIIPIEGEQEETQDELINDFISNVKYMRDSFRNGRISNAERWRDKLAEELDDIMRS